MAQHQALRLADLVRPETALTPDEAVAITLAVAERLGWCEPPSDLDGIVLRGDGTVHLPRPADAAPALPAHYAGMLHQLLTRGSDDAQPRVPGPLLLLIARARGDIDLPAFASADQFRHALLRFLSRPAQHVIADAVARVRPAPAAHRTVAAPTRAPERRTTGPRVDELRRLLRESDLERLVLLERERQRASAVASSRLIEPDPLESLPLSEPATPVPSPRLARAAAVAALLIAAGGGAFVAQHTARPATAPAASTTTSERSRFARHASLGGTGGAAATPSSERAGPAAVHHSAAVDTGAAAAAANRQIPGHAFSLPPDSAPDLAGNPAALHTSAGSTAPAAAREPEPDTVSVSTDRTASAPANEAASSSEGRGRTSPQDAGAARERSTRPALQTLNVPARTAYSPSFSPDGGSVYFHAEDRTGSRLMRADTDEAGDVREVATIVDDGAQNFHVRLSPDGTRVAFDSDRDGVRGVYVAGRDGTHVQRVSGPGYAAVPVWSPNGRALAYIRAEPRAPRTWNLWRLSLDSGRQQQLTRHRYGQAWPGSWFADGERVCYTHEDHLYVLDVRTGHAREFASPVHGRLVRTAAVSPNGAWVVFQVYRDGMWLLDLRDGSMRRVLEDPSAEEFTWSPDGRRIAFHSRREGHWGVWVMASPS